MSTKITITIVNVSNSGGEEVEIVVDTGTTLGAALETADANLRAGENASVDGVDASGDTALTADSFVAVSKPAKAA